MKGKLDKFIGKRFGRLVVIKEFGKDKNRHVLVECLCDCGNIKVVLWQNLKRGMTSSCGCYFKEKVSNSLKQNYIKGLITKRKNREEFRKKLIEKKYGRLTVKNIIVNITKQNKDIEDVECVCDCGNKIKTRLYNILNGHTKSCGCLQIYRLEKGEAGFNIVYEQYKRRSKNKNRVFDLSKEEFKKLTQKECFYCGRLPSTIKKSKSKYSTFVYNGIDRIDSDKGYIKDNVITCCEMCNKMKTDHSLDEFKNHIEKIYKHLINKGKE